MYVGEASDPSAHDRTQPFGVDEEAEHGSFLQPAEEGFTISMDQGEEEESAQNDSAQQQEDGSREIEVKVTRAKHITKPDEFAFKNRKRQQVWTTKSDWTARTREGRTVWVYKHGKKSVYWTKKLG